MKKNLDKRRSSGPSKDANTVRNNEMAAEILGTKS